MKKSYIIGSAFIIFNIIGYISVMICVFTGTKYLWGNPEIQRSPYILRNTCGLIYWLLLFWLAYECKKSGSKLLYALFIFSIVEIYRVIVFMGFGDVYIKHSMYYGFLRDIGMPIFWADRFLTTTIGVVYTFPGGEILMAEDVIRIVLSVILLLVSVRGIKKIRKSKA